MTTSNSGVAGRTNYGDWNKKVAEMVDEAEKEEEKEQEEAKKQLGLDGKYAFSKDDQAEREKSAKLENSKRVLETYRQREANVMQTYKGMLKTISTEESKADDGAQTIRLTRGEMEAGKRVVTICDTTGNSQKDMIVLTQDLSHLESRMNAPLVQPKTNKDDAENGVVAPTTQPRTIYGLIKVFISNVHNCTISIKCKLITGTVEMSHCTNVILKIEQEATVATCQVDLCKSVSIEYHDAPSGKNMPGQRKVYWGDDPDDRVFTAGVSDMRISVFRDGFEETSVKHDYIKDGAKTIGNASDRKSVV